MPTPSFSDSLPSPYEIKLAVMLRKPNAAVDALTVIIVPPAAVNGSAVPCNQIY